MEHLKRGKKKPSILFSLIFFLFGAYFLNLVFNFLPLPKILLENELYLNGINLIAGVLIVLGGFKFLFPGKRI